MLKQHHSKEHEAVAELDIEEVEQDFPKQKAWGCPCCVACFYNLEDWGDHEKAHGQSVMCHDKNGDTKIVGWEWTTLVASLIFGSENLRDAQPLSTGATTPVLDGKMFWQRSNLSSNDMSFRQKSPATMPSHP
jgi:hypothetical protein